MKYNKLVLKFNIALSTWYRAFITNRLVFVVVLDREKKYI